MEPPPDHSGHASHDALSAETIHDLRVPLTVIRAQAQMLERWVHRNNTPEADVVLARLCMIDTMVARLVLELDVLREVSPTSSVAEPDGAIDD